MALATQQPGKLGRRYVLPVATLLVLIVFCFLAWIAWSPPRDPIVCRIVSSSEWARAARLSGVAPGSGSGSPFIQTILDEIETGALSRSAIHNPLLIGDAFGRVEVWNHSTVPILVEPTTSPNARYGTVYTRVW